MLIINEMIWCSDVDKHTVQMLVVDEADQMISQDGFQEETVNLKRYTSDQLSQTYVYVVS